MSRSRDLLQTGAAAARALLDDNDCDYVINDAHPATRVI